MGFNQPSLSRLCSLPYRWAPHCSLNWVNGRELTFIGDAGVHSLVVDSELAPVIESVKERLPCRHYFSVGGDVDGFMPLESAMASASPLADVVELAAHDTLIIMYTSGTTGLPKGAMLTHGNIVWNNVNASLAFGNKSTDVLLTAAPLFHIGGLNVMTISALQVGSPLVLLRHFDPARSCQRFSHTK